MFSVAWECLEDLEIPPELFRALHKAVTNRLLAIVEASESY